jgi:predicted transcriptional regulator of viral defense system
MAHFDDIYEIAADNYGLVSAKEAGSAGVTTAELSRYVREGRLGRIGHGLYRLARYTPNPYDSYAEAVALVGAGAYLYGESVIAMHALAPTNPKFIRVATPKRVRRALPDHIIVEQRAADGPLKSYEGIPSQSVFEAIRSCKGQMMSERLAEAAEKARRNGLITKTQYDSLAEELAR